MSSSVHFDNNVKYIVISGEEPTQRSDDTILTTEASYLINFTRSGKRFVLSIYYIGINSFLFANAAKRYHFKTKDSEIKDYTPCLGNVSKDITN